MTLNDISAGSSFRCELAPVGAPALPPRSLPCHARAMERRTRPPRPPHRRSAAERRQQAARAQARVVQTLLRGFKEVSAHRGCQPTILGRALQAALLTPSDKSGGQPPQGDSGQGHPLDGARPRGREIPHDRAPTRKELRPTQCAESLAESACTADVAAATHHDGQYNEMICTCAEGGPWHTNTRRVWQCQVCHGTLRPQHAALTRPKVPPPTRTLWGTGGSVATLRQRFDPDIRHRAGPKSKSYPWAPAAGARPKGTAAPTEAPGPPASAATVIHTSPPAGSRPKHTADTQRVA